MTGDAWNTPTRLCAAALAVGIAVLIATFVPSWERLTARATSLPLPTPATEPRSPSALSFTDFSEVIERPLFNGDRKADPPPITPQDIRQISLANYRLAGIVTSGTMRIALIEQQGTAKALKLAIGDSLDGRVVKEITPGGVIFGGPAGGTLEFPKAQAAGTKTHDVASTPFGARGIGIAQ